MSTSNSTDYNQTRDDIIVDALWRLGVVRSGGTVPTNDYTRCSTVLNKLVKHLQAIGLHTWAENEGTLFLINGQSKYTITGSGNIAGDDSLNTTISSSSSGTTLTVTSTTGMSIADKIGIELDNGTRQWTTIVSVDSSTSLTITDALTNTASATNTVYTYTNNSTKPIGITSIRFRDTSNIDVPLMILGRDEYMEISDKTLASSTISTAMVEIGRTSTSIYMWPVPDSCKYRLVYSYSRQLQDFDNSSDNPDFPSEWLETLTLNLMAKIAPAYGKKDQELQSILMDAKQSLKEMKLNDINNGSIKVCPQDRDL